MLLDFGDQTGTSTANIARSDIVYGDKYQRMADLFKAESPASNLINSAALSQHHHAHVEHRQKRRVLGEDQRCVAAPLSSKHH